MSAGAAWRGILVVLAVLLAGCGSRPPASIPPTTSPTQPPAPTPAPGLWVAPGVPAGLAESIVLPDGWSRAATAGEATVRLELGRQDVVSRWVYALAAPFPTLTDDVSTRDLRSAWAGEPPDGFGVRLLMDANTREVLAALWDQPPGPAVTVLPAEELLAAAWEAGDAWAIIPFEQIEPRWKVLAIDGISPLHKTFANDAYALTVPVSLSGGALDLPAGNRDPGKLTTVVTTGTTALVRGTAVLMETNGLLYPAEEIAPLLQQADLTHVSNEIPFWPDCPRPRFNQASLVFCSQPDYIQLLEYIGTDVVELTGDHFNDYGPQAMLYTLEMYRQRGWQYYGGGADLEEGLAPALFDHNGNRVAFIGCNAKGGGYATASASSPGAAACGHETLWAEIARLKQEGYVVIATFQHQEYYRYTVDPRFRSDFTAMVEAGADVVLGSQAHQPQNFEFYEDGFIHYGPGNLFFDQYITPGGDQRYLDRAFIDRHVIYAGRHINTELITIRFVDFARSRFMTPDERAEFLRLLFAASGWEASR